jgi:hypothetical protein
LIWPCGQANFIAINHHTGVVSTAWNESKHAAARPFPRSIFLMLLLLIYKILILKRFIGLLSVNKIDTASRDELPMQRSQRQRHLHRE